MEERQFIPRHKRGSRIERTDISEGMTVVFDWSPYGWYTRGTDISGRVKARVVDVCDISGDIKVETENGETLRDYGEGRRYVSGRADFQDGVPSRTDVGTGAKYYEVDE